MIDDLPTLRDVAPVYAPPCAPMPALRVADVIASTYRVTATRAPRGADRLVDATDLVLRRPVVLRFAAPGNPSDVLPIEARRLVRAGPLAAEIFATGVYAGFRFVAVEPVDGIALGDALATRSLHAAVATLVDVAEAVADADARQVRLGGVGLGTVHLLRRRVVFEALTLGQLGEFHLGGLARGELRQLAHLVHDVVLARTGAIPMRLTALLVAVECDRCTPAAFAAQLADLAVTTPWRTRAGPG
ncbi:MAG: hypothetical protein KA201_25300 [Kofleriaceae bacterium]|jgi:hypothetical protein|nr:hypothetical protein [Kofleriaceae bacterium]